MKPKIPFDSLVESLIKQHKEIFPNATLETQVSKLGEELLELKRAYTRKEKESERGDVLYVVVSLMRFPEASGLVDYFLDTMYFNKSDMVKARLNNTLYMTGCKVLARHNKGAYYWTGTNYERDKSK